MGKTINILGDTPKQQWLNAIMIFEECIYGNVRIVHDVLAADMSDFDWDGELENLDIAMRNTRNFADEMRRLVEGVFDD